MLQQVMTAPGVIEFREVPIPEPKAGEVLVKIMRIGEDVGGPRPAGRRPDHYPIVIHIADNLNAVSAFDTFHHLAKRGPDLFADLRGGIEKVLIYANTKQNADHRHTP